MFLKAPRLAITIAVITAFGGIVSSSARVSADSVIDKLKDVGTVTVAIGNEPPWTEITPEGELKGVGPDIDRAVLKAAGITDVEGVVMEYGAMIPAVNASRVTFMSSGGLAIKPKRCESMLFSQPVLCFSEAFMVRKGDENRLTTYASVASEGAKIGIIAGGIEMQYAKDAGIADDKIVPIPEGPSAASMLSAGRIDAIALPGQTLEDLAKKLQDDSLVLVNPVTDAPMSCAGAGFKKADRDLRDFYDEGLATIMANGEFGRILANYGLEGLEELPATTSRDEQCGDVEN